MTTPASATARFPRARLIALVLGILAAVACCIGALSHETREQFFRAYLFGWMFWLGVSLGGLSIVMLHNLTGGMWGFLLRRIGETASLLLPLMAVLFIPILFGLHELYPWARPEELLKEEVLRHRQPYLNIPFFLGRAVVYFAIWIVVAFRVRSLARQVQATNSSPIRTHLRAWSSLGLILYLVTMTHAGIDWAMSRDIEFYSTTFGLIMTVGQTLSAVAFSILVLAVLKKDITAAPAPGLGLDTVPPQNPPTAGAPSVLNDVGNILLTLVILWAYISFMQLLVIWMGNTREDNGYYVKRGLSQPGGWRYFALALIIMHFFIPFFVLLFRATKSYLPALTAIAGVVFAAHLGEQYWLIAPSSELKGPHFDLSWLDFAAPIAVGGLWLAGFLTLLPLNMEDPAVDTYTLPETAPAKLKGPQHA